MKIYFFIILLLIISLKGVEIGKTFQSETYQGNDIVWEGINAFYNEEFNRSVKILSEARQDYPEHPTVHFVWAISEWLKIQAYDGAEASYGILEKDLNDVANIYETLVKKYPEEPQYQLYLGATYGMKARVHLGKKEWLGVLYEGFKGYRKILKVHRNTPTLKDVYFPMGVLNFYVANSFAIVKFFANLLGMEADEDTGLSQIQISAEEGEYSWIEANSALAWIYLWMKKEFELALPITNTLRTHFPHSVYFQYLYTESLIFLHRFQEAEKNLELVFSLVEFSPPASKKGWIPTLKYQSALIKFYQGDLENALLLVTQSIDEYNTELDTPLGFGYLLRGKIYDLEGNREQAVLNYRSALKLNNYTWAMDEAKRYLQVPYSTLDKYSSNK